MTKNNLLILVFGIAVAVFVLIVFNVAPVNLGARDNIFSGGVTNASSTVATTTGGTLILAANYDRQYVSLCNDDATNPVYVHFASATTSVVSKEGYKLKATECYEIDTSNLYVGAIYGIATGGNVVITTLSK